MMCNVTKANETTLIKDKFDNTHTYYYDYINPEDKDFTISELFLFVFKKQ